MDEIGGVWRTIGGRRVFIKNGQDIASAMKESGKFKANIKSKKIQSLDSFEDQINFIKQNQDELYNIVENSKNYDKKLCLKFQERNFFNEKPTVLNDKEFNKLSDKEYIKTFRGYIDGEKTAEEYINNFKYKENAYGTGGYQYGVGHYTITDKDTALQYGKIIEIAIPKNARIIEHSDLLNIHYKNFEKYNDNLEEYYDKYGDKVTTILDYMNSNESATAILQNYDIVKKNNMYIILNRGIIKVKE